MQQGKNSSCEAIYKFDDDSFEVLEFNIKDDFKKLILKNRHIKIIYKCCYSQHFK